MVRPRNEKINTYKETDKGMLTYHKRDLEAEIPIEVGDTGMCYASSMYAKKKGVILIYRD